MGDFLHFVVSGGNSRKCFLQSIQSILPDLYEEVSDAVDNVRKVCEFPKIVEHESLVKKRSNSVLYFKEYMF